MNYKKEKFKVAGVSHYTSDIMKNLAYKNDDYLLSADDLADIYDIGDRVFEYSFNDVNVSLVPEPTNEYDPNAIRVEVDGVLIGYIKRGSCSHVKNLLKSPDFDHITVEIGGGKYKRLYEDEDDDMIKVEKDSYELFADLSIYLRQDKTELEDSSISTVSKSSYPKHASSSTAVPEKKKGGALSIFLIVLGILFLISGINGFAIDILNGFVGLALGGVFMYFGIKKRRN